MTIDRGLKRRQRAADFDIADQKILIALSSKKWRWRTVDNLLAITRLEYDDLTQRLADLIDRSIVKGSINWKTQEPTFGLTERVGGGKGSIAQQSL